MFANSNFSGKHMICDICGIRNIALLHDLELIKIILNQICFDSDFAILEKIDYKFNPQGISIIYLLSESHISIHTFPERNYIAFDLYTCRQYPDDSVYLKIYDFLISSFNANYDKPIIINRTFDNNDFTNFTG